MKVSFADKYSWKCMLGIMSRDIEENEKYAKWRVGKKQHVVFFDNIKEKDVEEIKELVPFSFHYIGEDDVALLKKHFVVKRSKLPSVYLDLEKTLDLAGRKNKAIRQKYNRIDKLGIEIESDFRKIEDVEAFVKRWSGVDELYADKYFQNHSGKNKFFFSNGFHRDCINVFLYRDDVLLGYGILSPPNEKGFSNYVLGKALYADVPVSGLSEYLDLTLYKKGWESGVRFVNLGASFTKPLLEYKRKFLGQTEFLEYEGKVLEVK